MKRLNNIERWVFIIRMVFLTYGLVSIIWPKARVTQHFTNDELGTTTGYSRLVVSRTGARLYGIFATVLGVGMMYAAFCRDEK